MTQKEVTGILYEQIPYANRMEIKTIDNKDYYVFKSSDEELYMVCVLSETTESSHSDVLLTLEECYEWITQNS